MEQEEDEDGVIVPPTTPLSRAIDAAAARLPAVMDSPKSIRSSRRTSIVIAANAMADAGGVDGNDSSRAGQIVDEAAISLDLQTDRLVPVDLNARVLCRHHFLADSLVDNAPAVRAGLDDALSLARVEEAIGRAVRMRGGSPSSGDPAVASLVAKLLDTCERRGVSVDAMSDGELMQTVEDVRDAV